MVELFARLGGREAARFTEASWQGAQLAFAGGIRLEVLEPRDSPADDFLDRFLARTGPGPHHVTFKVGDIRACIAHLWDWGIEPLKIDLSNEGWMECFLHPNLGIGTVVQLAQSSGDWSAEHALPPLAPGAPGWSFLGAELRCDMGVADTIFHRLLGAAIHDLDGARSYSWTHGTLVARPAGAKRPAVERLIFRAVGNVDTDPASRDEEPLFGGPATVRTLAADQPWPD